MAKRSTSSRYKVRPPETLEIGREQLLDLYYFMRLNRRLDERLGILYRQNHVVGGLYSSLGEEATSVGSAYALDKSDYIAAMIRNLGAVLVRGVSPVDVVAQYCARATGPTGGRDLNLHFGSVAEGLIAPISVVGALIPVMAGIALELKMHNKRRVALTYIGDGGSSTTDFHEGINFASIHSLPFILIVQNNGYAYSTPTSLQANIENLATRASNYGIHGETVDGNNVLAVLDAVKRARAMCLDGRGPVMIETKTFRRKGHAEHDDAGYVPEELRREWEAKDPIDAYRRYLRAREEPIAEDELNAIDDRIEAKLESDVREALDAPFPEPDVRAEDVYAR
jgi:pyruvate dehydrogenase E1 component alpha subunit/2-oxoisovalerate dehydrogenase E1 component alpha subunit